MLTVLLVLAACDPDRNGPITQVATTYDPGLCEFDQVMVTLDETYWGEWRDTSVCREASLYVTGTDGACYSFGLDCDVYRPYVTEDPAFQGTPEQHAYCDIVWGHAKGDPCPD